MRSVNITELRSHLSKYLSIVEQGSEIEIISHGKIIARMIPPLDRQQEALEQLVQ